MAKRKKADDDAPPTRAEVLTALHVHLRNLYSDCCIAKVDPQMTADDKAVIESLRMSALKGMQTMQPVRR